MIVEDETKARPLGSDAEIWIRGHGSWWIKKVVRFGSTVREIAGRDVGKTETISVYPDGRDSSEIKIPARVTGDMNPRGSDRDALRITIEDRRVTAFGLAVKGATGKLDISQSR